LSVRVIGICCKDKKNSYTLFLLPTNYLANEHAIVCAPAASYIRELIPQPGNFFPWSGKIIPLSGNYPETQDAYYP
jgi:hypothetical protein